MPRSDLCLHYRLHILKKRILHCLHDIFPFVIDFLSFFMSYYYYKQKKSLNWISLEREILRMRIPFLANLPLKCRWPRVNQNRDTPCESKEKKRRAIFHFQIIKVFLLVDRRFLSWFLFGGISWAPVHFSAFSKFSSPNVILFLFCVHFTQNIIETLVFVLFAELWAKRKLWNEFFFFYLTLRMRVLVSGTDFISIFFLRSDNDNLPEKWKLFITALFINVIYLATLPMKHLAKHHDLPLIEFGVFIFSWLPSWLLPLLFLVNPIFVLIVDEDDEAEDAEGGIEMAVDGGGVVLSTMSGPLKQSADEPAIRLLPLAPKAPPFKVLNSIVPCWWCIMLVLALQLLTFRLILLRMVSMSNRFNNFVWLANIFDWVLRPLLLLLSRELQLLVPPAGEIVKLPLEKLPCRCWCNGWWRNPSRYSRLSIEKEVESRLVEWGWDCANLLGAKIDDDPAMSAVFSVDVISFLGFECWMFSILLLLQNCCWK